ncbi:hypothetical protein AURDEDRAFT_117806 [Auricularia subglabra TFB-10046 SS5]|uniref:Uncharacterized protein n=1 Tax=Auricularia subglabra (strain TFB-10046 / SS5) TaxID=717982 RepID=J0CU21_AURST|nr:hypothetical protein AURDEDRAFT_117806 [Auricularia subglabra TFB-10046 SS5]
MPSQPLLAPSQRLSPLSSSSPFPMAYALRYTRPQSMAEEVFKTCAEWAYKFDQAVWQEGDLPMGAPPYFYDAFRRANPNAIDPGLALNMQRNRRCTFYAFEAQAGRLPGQADSAELVPLKAVELMLNATRTILSDSQQQSTQQLQTAVQAIEKAVKPAPSHSGYERRIQNRRPPLPRRPRNSIRAHHHHPHAHVPHVHLDCGRHGNRDAPPPYRRRRRARRDPSPDPDYQRGPTPHPLEGFLFQGVGAEPQGEDQVMRDETPFDFGAAGPAQAAFADLGIMGPVQPVLADFVHARSPEDTPARTNESIAGTATPRPRSPLTEIAPEEPLGLGDPAVPPGLGLEIGTIAPANTEYAGSVTDDFENLDLGVANHMLNEIINPEAVAAI